MINWFTRHYKCPSCSKRLRYFLVAGLGNTAVPCPHCVKPMKASPYALWSRIIFMIAAALILYITNPNLPVFGIMGIVVVCVIGLYLLPVAVGPVRTEPVRSQN